MYSLRRHGTGPATSVAGPVPPVPGEVSGALCRGRLTVVDQARPMALHMAFSEAVVMLLWIPTPHTALPSISAST